MTALFLYTWFMFGWDVSWSTSIAVAGYLIVVLMIIYSLIELYIREQKDPEKKPELRILVLLIIVIVVVIGFFLIALLAAD